MNHLNSPNSPPPAPSSGPTRTPTVRTSRAADAATRTVPTTVTGDEYVTFGEYVAAVALMGALAQLTQQDWQTLVATALHDDRRHALLVACHTALLRHASPDELCRFARGEENAFARIAARARQDLDASFDRIAAEGRQARGHAVR